MYSWPIFRQLVELLHWILVSLHDWFSSIGLSEDWTWGLAIIGLTIIVRLILFPLTWKQYKSSQAMQVLQPHIKELQRKYKDDRAKLQQETMKLYQEHKVNPFASCLPLLLQLPVFIGLYVAISGRADYLDQVTRPGAQERELPVDPQARRAGPHLHPAGPLHRHADDLDRTHAGLAVRPHTALADARHAAHLRGLPVQLPVGAVRLLGHDQHLDDRPAARHPSHHAEAGPGECRRRRQGRWGEGCSARRSAAASWSR